jgi:hypothetical protein
MYAILDTKNTKEFYLVRQGRFSPEYELTDNINSYGKITYHRLSRGKARAESVNCTWVFQRRALFSRAILITDENGAIIGEVSRGWFSPRAILTLQTGFRAEFYRTSIFSRENIWESASYGKIMHIKSFLFSLTDIIYIDQSMTPVALIPLLTFLGSYLTILRRQRKSRH